jgi:hypothetical protein
MIPTGMIFNIGTIVLGAGFGLWGVIDPQHLGLISAVSGIIIPSWGAIGTALTTSSKTTQQVADAVDTTPAVKQALVQAVSNLKGVDPIQVNKNADATLIALGASKDPELAKILPPKP